MIDNIKSKLKKAQIDNNSNIYSNFIMHTASRREGAITTKKGQRFI